MNKETKLIGLIIFLSTSFITFTQELPDSVKIIITKITNKTGSNLTVVQGYNKVNVAKNSSIEGDWDVIMKQWGSAKILFNPAIIITDQKKPWGADYAIGVILEEIKKQHHYKLIVFGWNPKKTSLTSGEIYHKLHKKELNPQGFDYRPLNQTETSSGIGLFGIQKGVNPINIQYKLEITLDGMNFEKSNVIIKSDVKSIAQ